MTQGGWHINKGHDWRGKLTRMGDHAAAAAHNVDVGAIFAEQSGAVGRNVLS